QVRNDFEGYIQEPGRLSQGISAKPRLALRERDSKFFKEYVQGFKFDELFSLDTAQLEEPQQNIQRNAFLLKAKLESTFHNDLNDLIKFGACLVQKCYLVVVSTPTQQSAFRVFSVLNSRGLDLLPTDIIKSDVIGQIDNTRQEYFTSKWEELEVKTGRAGFTELFSHIRMIYAQTKSKRSLLEEFKEHVIGKVTSSEKLIENIIEPFAEAYLTVRECNYVSTADADKINDLLRWLNKIDNSDWIPSAILFLADKGKSSDEILMFLTKLERLTAFMHLCAKNVNQRIERYSLVLKELTSEPSFKMPVRSLELTQNEIDELTDVLASDIYKLTARRRNYLILRLDSLLSDGAATYNPAILTIEHVLPQTVTSGSIWEQVWPDEKVREEWVHKLANLVPLTLRRNAAASNFEFDHKKRAYFGGRQGVSSYILTTQVLNTAEWTPDTVKERQDALLNTLKEAWEL
ncbi:MAG: DUF1524 domain-containing protein, partial [Alcaligenaceae bacterium]|nr:DUF1524 domain-containing protein [Alcaligenaceae bacterium]